MFQQKSPEMVELLKRLAPNACTFGESCPTCGKPISYFRNEISRREFKISGMCQKCQDNVFGED